jgi:four helix bundle protein
VRFWVLGSRGMGLACVDAMPSKNYTDLIAWQKAMALAEAVYVASRQLPAEERFGLSAQMRRAAVSIPANIAEGQGRRTNGEFGNQLSVAHGSIRELETHVMLAGRLRLMSSDVVDALLARLAEVGRLTTGLANSLSR